MKDKLSVLKNRLMEIEMNLNQVLNQAIDVLRDRVKINIDDVKNATEEYFKVVAGAVDTYLIEFKAFALNKGDQIMAEEAAKEEEKEKAKEMAKEAGQDQMDVAMMDDPDEQDDDEYQRLLELVFDRDRMQGLIDTQAEFWQKSVQETENKITKAITVEWDKKLETIKVNKHARNR